MRFIILILIALIINACESSGTPEEIDKNVIKNETPLTQSTKNKVEYTYKIIFSPQSGWGYQILNNGQLYINQPHIPAVSGSTGFTDESKAIKTAKFVIYKLHNNILPPTVSVNELDSLGVLK